MAIRAVILDDSLICRMRLREILEVGGEIEVVGEASSGDRVLELIDRTKPKVLLVDLEMPGVAGHATIERVMANRPLPILVVTGLPAGARGAEVFESIRRGALELATKPTNGDTRAEANLRQHVKRLSTVPVVRHVAGNLMRPSAITQLKPAAASTAGSQRVVGVGASAGGPLAMAAVLSGLPNPCRAAIVVVQHLPVGFTKAFAEFLRGRVPTPVRIVEHEARLEPGVIFLAADDRHVTVTRSHVRAVESPAVEGHRPSVDVLFHSLAENLGSRAAGVILSGMGCDGVSGLLAMRAAGALTVAQSQDTCGVYGMPGAAMSRGAAQFSHAPLDIAALVGNWTNDHPLARVN
jgi:two-component system, chemotaxis family, protein-glutamate methylesterase/glutaminase